MAGVFSRVQTVRSDPIWLRFPAIRRYQEGAAANPRTLKAQVATFVPLTKVEGFTDAGFPATPSLEPVLTAFFGVRQANMIAGRRPTLASPGTSMSPARPTGCTSVPFRRRPWRTTSRCYLTRGDAGGAVHHLGR